MNVHVEMFTKTYLADLIIDNNGAVHMELLPESKADLEQYLRLVLPAYIELPTDEEISLEEMIRLGTEWEDANPDSKLAEPYTLLPYEIPKETKGKLEQLAKDKGISMSLLLVQMIDKTFDKVVVNHGKIES